MIKLMFFSLVLYLCIFWLLIVLNIQLQPLFRKIAAALPGMETLSSAKQEDMVDVNLKSSNANASQSQAQSGGCAC